MNYTPLTLGLISTVGKSPVSWDLTLVVWNLDHAFNDKAPR